MSGHQSGFKDRSGQAIAVKKQAVVKENKLQKDTNKYVPNELITTSKDFTNF